MRLIMSQNYSSIIRIVKFELFKLNPQFSNVLYAKLPVMTRRRLKLAEFAAEQGSIQDLNISLQEGSGGVQLGENAMKDNPSVLQM